MKSLKLCFYDFSVNELTGISSLVLFPLFSQVCKVGTSVNLFGNLKLKHRYVFAQDAFGTGHWIARSHSSNNYTLVLLSLYQKLHEALLKLYLLLLIHIKL